MLDLVNAVRHHAMANYDVDGWDYLVECYDDGDIIEIISDAEATTVPEAIKAVHKEVKFQDDYRKEIESTEF
jgi:hypothetical protein